MSSTTIEVGIGKVEIPQEIKDKAKEKPVIISIDDFFDFIVTQTNRLFNEKKDNPFPISEELTLLPIVHSTDKMNLKELGLTHNDDLECLRGCAILITSTDSVIILRDNVVKIEKTAEQQYNINTFQL